MQVYIVSAKHKEFAIGLDDDQSVEGTKAELKHIETKPSLQWLIYDRKIHTLPKKNLALEPQEHDGKIILVLKESKDIENKFYIYEDGSIRNKQRQAIDIEDGRFEAGADIVLKEYEKGKESQQWLIFTKRE